MNEEGLNKIVAF